MSGEPPAAATRWDRTQARVARALGALPPRVQRRLAGGGPVVIDGQELDAGVQLLLRARELGGRSSLISGGAATPSVERARARREALAFARSPTPVAAVRQFEINGAGGPLRVRHYRPRPDGQPQPLLLFVHGGGWVICDLDTHDEPCRLLCRHGGIQVLSIDYRLAPEHPFPAGLDDVLAACRWAQQHAGDLGADPARIAIGGDSAGGNLSAVAAQELSRGADRPPALQVLIYPATDLAETRRSLELFGDGFLLTNADRDWFAGHYLAGPGLDPADPRLSPLRAADLSGLPRAIVLTAGFDPLRDEGESYAAAMRAAGTEVIAVRAAGLIHGFMNMTSANRASRDAALTLAGMIRAALGSGAHPEAQPGA